MQKISQKIKHGMKWQFIATTITTVLYFVNGIILARILVPKDFGLYGMAQLLATFVAVFWQLGINSAIVQKKDISDNDLNTAFTISIMMGFFCFAINWVGAPYLASFFKEPAVALITRLIGISFIIYAFDRVPSALLGRNMFFKNISLVGILNPLLYGLVAIPLALMGRGPFSFACGILAGALAMTVLRIYWGFKLFKWRPRISLNMKSARRLLGFGIFVTLSGTVNFILMNLQRIITGRFLGSIDLGYFTKASNLGMLPAEKVRTNVVTVLLPGFSSIQDNKGKVRDWFRKFNFFTYAFVSPVLLFFVFFPNEFITGLFGEKWISSAAILPWLSLSVLVSLPLMYFKTIFNAIGKPHIVFGIGLFMLIPVTVGLLVAVKWGIIGIAIALFAVRLVSLVVDLAVMHLRNIITVKDFIISSIEPILISLISCIIANFIFKMGVSHISISELKVITMLCVYGIIVAIFFCCRAFMKGYIGYLGFEIKEVLSLR